ncbi:BTB/POZ and TAZ domain-containing protein 4 [Prunus yedoensis var. nudiflora]|uniref:BTB/POZ and TAZ domain-containing protein 4 n=1 Tax=Prunus yedoensis var. nudiflora TaxID=2094558 RepID=A0A314XUX0_PRUYE|nr:BTB/POZ and TAZ domain-containing protein 4 [Prunus yedoensis var. nudiflora]
MLQKSHVSCPSPSLPLNTEGDKQRARGRTPKEEEKNQTKRLGSLGDASQRKRHRRWESDSSTALLPKIHLFKRNRSLDTNVGYSCVSTATKDSWERLFDEGYRADVSVNTDDGGIIYAHANILGMASPAMKGLLKQSSRFRRQRSISILGVPHDAVRVFIRFLYSSCYEKREMEEFVVHLLVLSHVYLVPQLKQECEKKLEHGLLTTENVVDIFQLALLMESDEEESPCTRKELVESMIEEDNRQKERIKK